MGIDARDRNCRCPGSADSAGTANTALSGTELSRLVGTELPGFATRPNSLPPLRSAVPLQPNGSLTPATPVMNTPGSSNPSPFANPIAQPQEVPLPQPEMKIPLNARDVSLKRVAGGWQLWAGFKMVRDFGDQELVARNALRVYKDLRPTEWVTIGSPRPIVEYVRSSMANRR